MQFKEDAEVLTADGRKIGKIDRVVVDPATGEVTHLVVRKGFLFSTDKVLPVNLVADAAEEVRLKKGLGRADDLPDFEETEYIPIGGVEDFKAREARQARRFIWYHTRVTLPWWTNGPDPEMPKPLFVKSTRRNIPEGTVPLEEGAKVVDAGGEPVGEVEEIFAEPEEHRVVHILVSRGTFVKERKLIPTAWVRDILEGSVHLSVGKAIVDGLPEPAPDSLRAL